MLTMSDRRTGNGGWKGYAVPATEKKPPEGTAESMAVLSHAPAALAPKGLGAASLLMVACDTP
jgi:hypothetical protein